MELAGLVALGALIFYGGAVYLALRLLLTLREAGRDIAEQGEANGSSRTEGLRGFRAR